MTVSSHIIIMPDAWYVCQMKKRLERPKCEDRETVIDIFQHLWPRLMDRAEEFYDTAVAEPRTAAELMDAYSKVARGLRVET